MTGKSSSSKPERETEEGMVVFSRVNSIVSVEAPSLFVLRLTAVKMSLLRVEMVQNGSKAMSRINIHDGRLLTNHTNR